MNRISINFIGMQETSRLVFTDCLVVLNVQSENLG